MKLYLAGPMSGVPHFNFPLFNGVASRLREDGYEVFNPAEKAAEKYGEDLARYNSAGDERIAERDVGFNRREALMEDLTFIVQQADAVMLLPDWEKSRGATAEREVARAVGIPVVTWEYYVACKLQNYSAIRLQPSVS